MKEELFYRQAHKRASIDMKERGGRERERGGERGGGREGEREREMEESERKTDAMSERCFKETRHCYMMPYDHSVYHAGKNEG